MIDPGKEKEFELTYARRFGEIAMKKGFVSKEQVKEALAEQLFYLTHRKNGPRKLIGEILYENGWMSLQQVKDVLADMTDEQ